jgi:ribonuclease P protein component
MGGASVRPLSFPKSARLRVRGEFLAVKEQGKGFAEGPLAVSWRPRPAEQSRPGSGGMTPAVARVGLTVSSKVGESVVRNRVKRRLREAVRHELAGLPAIDLVIVARGSSVHATVPEMRAWLRKAARRMEAMSRRAPEPPLADRSSAAREGGAPDARVPGKRSPPSGAGA